MSIVNAGLEEYRNAFFVLNEKLVAKQLVFDMITMEKKGRGILF